VERSDVRGIREQRLLACLETGESELAIRVKEEPNASLGDAADARGDFGDGRERDVERVGLLLLHRLDEERGQPLAGVGDRLQLVEADAVHLLPAPHGGLEELADAAEVPVETALRHAEGTGQVGDRQHAQTAGGDGGERRLLPVLRAPLRDLFLLCHTVRY